MDLNKFRKKLKFYVKQFLKIMGDNYEIVYVLLNINNIFILKVGVTIRSIGRYTNASIALEGVKSGERLFYESFYYPLPELPNKSKINWDDFTKNLFNILEEVGLFKEFFGELETKLLEKL